MPPAGSIIYPKTMQRNVLRSGMEIAAASSVLCNFSLKAEWDTTTRDWQLKNGTGSNIDS